MITKTDIELKIVDSVDTSNIEGVLADSASNPDAFYVGRGYLAKGGEKVIENIDEKGTYPNVTVGNATKATTADTATRANTAATAATAVNISDAPVLTATEDEQITVKVGNKTSNPLTVPYAQRADFATDLSGRVEATPEVFTFRPSAGDKSIKDDNAFIRRIKGNSIRWEQKIKSIPTREDFEGVTTFYDANTNEIVIQNISRSANYTSGSTRWQIKPDIYPIVGHKYLLLADRYYKGVGVQIGGIYFDSNSIFSASTASIIYFRIDKSFDFASTCPIGKEIRLRMNLFDLTEMFDAGNEPTTVDEFRALYPNSYYPYNTGELRNLVCSGIKTVGFNEFNGTYARVLPNESYYLGGSYTSIGFAKELGGATETISIPSNRIYTPTQLGYIYASGTDICINLHHTGYRDGEYEPYKEVTHALPLSEITNGEPLRKAGSVYDEINETEYIRRVGVRGYATGDKDDATLLTDGRYTNYPLAEPIVKPIETPIDFNYYVEDFGTEEAILAENSAPFSADIIYQFNATDQVRNNSRNIQRLQKSVFTPSGTTSQYIRGDGSYADVSELASVIPIYDGEMDSPDGSNYDYEFGLFPQQYAKAKVTLDGDSNVLVRINVPDNADTVAEYWFELTIDETTPNITFQDPSNENAVFRFNGQILRNAVNIWHIITTDGGMRYFGEIKSYLTE